MRAIDAAQLIVNRLSRTGKSIDRNDLTKMLYLLDLTVQKHTGKRLVDEDFTTIWSRAIQIRGSIARRI